MKDFLTVQEAAAELEVSIQTIYRLVKDGSLPARRLAGMKSIRISRSDFEKYKIGQPIFFITNVDDILPKNDDESRSHK